MEDIRHKLSAFLMDNSPENPLVVDILLDDEETFGLCTMQIPHVTSIYQTNDGIIYFEILGYEEPIEFDDISKSWLNIIINNLNIK